jgi:adenylate cyclase
MERKLLELNLRWQAAEKPPVGMRIGIVTGEAVGGTLGSSDRWEYVVVGDTLNTAARLESFDKDVHPPDPLRRPCRILISGSTHERAGTRFEVEWVTEARLKGKQQLVAIYRVVGERQHEPSAGAMQPAVELRQA